MTISALTAAEVTFTIDTNLLVEFRALETLPWQELAPNARQVRIIVPTKVAEEMDGHKKKSGRLRRRGVEFGNIARAIEDSPDNRHELRASNPRITIEFGPIFRRSQLDADQYDLEDPDGRIVAEAAAIAGLEPGAVLLADDSKPIRLARQTYVAHARPPESWRRDDGPDERDSTIAELRREIGALPKLSIALPDGIDEKGTHVLAAAPSEIDEACVEAVFKAIANVERKVSRQESIARHGYSAPSPFAMAAFESYGVTDDQLKAYDTDYRMFLGRLRKWANLTSAVFTTPGPALPIQIDVGNDGDRAAEKVQVEAELTGDFVFAPRHLYALQIARGLDAPEPPQPRLGHLSPNLSDLLDDRRPPRPDIFHDHDEPSNVFDSKFVSWRCEEFRQNTHYPLDVVVVALKPNARGALSVTIGSAILAKSTTLTAPVVATDQPTNESMASFVYRRLDLFPNAYQDALATTLEGMTADEGA